MKPENLKELYIHQLRDIYSAETQLEEALPTMEKKATLPELKQAFKTHLEETKQQKKRLEEVFKMLDTSPKGATCQAMKGIVKEAKDFLDETHKIFGRDAPDEVVDAGLIAQAQRAEHYEITAYGTVASYAETLGRRQEKDLLGQTLEEEKRTDQKLTRLAEQLVNPAAVGMS